MTSPPVSILVVDDDVDACRNLVDILGDLGYEADAVHGGAAAIDLVQKRPFDIALLDLKMPGMNGVEVYRELKRLRPSIVAIIISAYATTENAREARSAGAWQVLAKPVDFTRLLPLIKEAADQPLVLVVDDDPDLCSNLWDLLRDQGYRVGCAHNAATARSLLQNMSFRVVLVDIRLPDDDGEGVFHEIREKAPETRVILVTGFRTEMSDLIGRVLAEGADAICYKPFDTSALLDKVQQLVDRRNQ